MSLSMLLYSIHLGFSLIGIVVISYGVLRSFYLFLTDIVAKKKVPCLFQHARLILCQSIIFGLEFLVASDVVRTMVSPDYNNIMILGGLVVIRTGLSFFLSREADQLEAYHKSGTCKLK